MARKTIATRNATRKKQHMLPLEDAGYDAAPPGEQAKAFGAYYTDAQIADFLAWWAIRSATDKVMDPCFGGGVFLRSACKRIRKLGGSPHANAFGVELDPEVHQKIADKLVDEYALARRHLFRADFFSVSPTEARAVDVIIGNPPFIRYQRFTGDARRQALARSLAEGVRLPELCSSWAPFLVHCVAMLRTGGRLAMVLPMEVAHAKYARPVLEHVRQSFATSTFLTFRKKLFPDLSEDTLLLLADEKGAGPGRFQLRDLAHPGLLTEVAQSGRWSVTGTRRVDAEGVSSGTSRLIEYFLPSRARDLYRELKASAEARRLGDLADVGIGYVTGANDFFHLDPKEARRRRIPRDFLKPAVRRGRALTGLRFTSQDWDAAAETGEAGYLLHIEKGQKVPASIEEYLGEGQLSGVDKAYKCRTRSPWFSVPHVYKPDAFLTYMSGLTPRLVANDADAFAPNSLHILRLHPDTTIPGDAVAALWQTSLTRLSAEIEGHALGGGMLKLEPSEAENVLMPCPATAKRSALLAIAEELDHLIRRGREADAEERADAAILRGVMGLSKADSELLRSGAVTLRARRGYGSTLNESA